MGAAVGSFHNLFQTTNLNGGAGYLSPEQLQEEEERKELQLRAINYVVNTIYYSMPVKTVALETASYGRQAAFITIDEKKALEATEADDAGAMSLTIANDLTKYPESVTVDEHGDITINPQRPIWTATGNEKVMEPQKISGLSLILSQEPPSAMDPPDLIASTTSSLTISWEQQMHEPLVDRFEVQFRPCHETPSSPMRWRALCTKNRMLGHDMRCTLENLKCASYFLFRIRRCNPAGWSDWSHSSIPCGTDADIPSEMAQPFASAISSEFAMLHWQPPCDNGSPIRCYTLRGKLAGGNATDEVLYEGPQLAQVITCIAGNPLIGGSVYTFEVRATNGKGSSVWSQSLVLQMPSDKQAARMAEIPDHLLRSKALWLECWDSETEKVFYFNRITGIRTPVCPVEFESSPDSPRSASASRPRTIDTQPSMDANVRFRTRRFRFLHRLYRGGDPSSPMAGGRMSPTQSFRRRAANAEDFLELSIRRDHLVMDSYRALRFSSALELRQKIKVTFVGEEGIDSGGLTKEWFLLLSKALCVWKYDEHGTTSLFRQVPDNAGWVELNPESDGHDDALLEYFSFVGKVMAKAVFDRLTLNLPLCHNFYRILRGDALGLSDLKGVDNTLLSSLSWMLEHRVEGILFENFSVPCNRQGKPETVDLCENGRDRDVTDENKSEYVDLMARWRLHYGVHSQLEALMSGISTLIPLESFNEFEVEELELLFNGKEDIDVDEIRAYTIYQGGYHDKHRIVLWLWQILRELSLVERGKFLQFVTGSNRIPLDGFDPPFNVTEGVDLNPLDALPTSHTCFNQIVIPRYGEYALFRKKLQYAIEHCEGFLLT